MSKRKLGGVVSGAFDSLEGKGYQKLGKKKKNGKAKKREREREKKKET